MIAGGVGVVCLTGALLWRADRAAEEGLVVDWANAHGLGLTDSNRPLVKYYLVLGRVLRTVGGVGGLVLGSLAHAATGADVNGGLLWWVWVMGGYLAGAMWAELFLTRPTPQRRGASLFPRRLRDYLPARLRWALRVAGVGSLAIGLAAWAFGADSPLTHAGASLASPTLSSAGALGLGLTGGALAGLVELLQVTIVRRPQPVVASDLLEADDAIRSSSVHSLAGAGLGMVLLIVAALTAKLMERSRLPFGLGAAPLVLFLASLVAWRYYSYRAWQVRRPVSTEPVPT